MSTPQQDLQRAMQHWHAGQFKEAELAAKRALKHLPDHTDALNIVGHCALQRGFMEQALIHLGRVVTLKPNFPPHQNNLGEVYRRMGRLDEAIAHYRRALAIDPNFVDSLSNLGVALEQKGQLKASAESLDRAVALNPGHVDAWINLAGTLLSANQPDIALRAADSAVKLAPQLALTHMRRGMALTRLGRFDEAIESLLVSARLSPEHAETQLQLGNAYEQSRQSDHAIEAFKNALRLMPGNLKVYYGLAPVLARVGRLDEAIEVHRAGTQIAPHDAALASNLLFGMIYQENADPRTLLEAHRDWARRFEAPLIATHRPHQNDPDPQRRLRLGYVSPDFREHCQSFFTTPLLANHDREQFEIVCYSDVTRPDAATERLRSHAHTWRDTFTMTYEQLATLIRDDGIDVLIDLTMHMAGNRLLTFARKPAPVQICWLAYPGTTGLETMDHRISDPQLDPPGTDAGKYSEQTLHLPETFWCYDPASEEPVSDLPSLRAGHITFGCLNNFYKVNPHMLGIWARVMAKVPDSRLIVLAPAGRHREELAATMNRAGAIEPSRIEFVEFQPRACYLKTYHRIDVALDTFPVNGHTTSLDAMWMGVPVVTLIGPTTVGRAGLSQLKNLGLSELAAQTKDDFVSIASSLARDMAGLAELRRTLRARMTVSPLMDAPRFARHMEAAYRYAWRQWCTKVRGETQR